MIGRVECEENNLCDPIRDSLWRARGENSRSPTAQCAPCPLRIRLSRLMLAVSYGMTAMAADAPRCST